MQLCEKNYRRRLPAIFAAIVILLFSVPRLAAQQSGIDRPYQPVILKGSDFPGFSNDTAPMNQLFLYKYSSANNSWDQIPFQFDEVELDAADTTKTTYFQTGDGMLDDLDELAFMARDLGNKAPTNTWVDNASALSFPRYEIELTDPLSIGSAGYVYLYRSTTLTIDPNLKDYVNYVAPPTGTGQDTIRGQTYEERHQSNGINNWLSVPVNANGSGQDMLDRLKLRFKAGLLTIDEDDFIFRGVRARDQRLRVIRELMQRIDPLPGFIPPIDFSIIIAYYGYSSVLSTDINITISGVSLLRQSFDFEPSVNGANWYNQNVTAALAVNGNSGNLSDPQAATVPAPNYNWYMLSSPVHGSFINIFLLPAGLGSSQKFYYHDSPSGTNDGTPDTGANGSWGDTGLLITGTNITGRFKPDIISYFLSKEQPREVAEALYNQTFRPLSIQTRSQGQTVAVQQNPDAAPLRFTLTQNSPNPVSPAAATTIRYELPFSGNTPVSLRIYNLLGQSVRELMNATQPAGQYEVRWDGRLDNGKLAPAGIYFYQLRAGQQTLTRKLMLLNR